MLPLISYHKVGVQVVQVDVTPRHSRGGAAVPSQHVLTRSLEVEGSAVKGVVVGVSKDGAHARLCRQEETRSWLAHTVGVTLTSI